MKNLFVIMSGFILCFYAGYGWCDDSTHLIWEFSYTKSDMRDPYVWNAEKKDYERPSKPDDQFDLEFPMTGDFDMRMLAQIN